MEKEISDQIVLSWKDKVRVEMMENGSILIETKDGIFRLDKDEEKKDRHYVAMVAPSFVFNMFGLGKVDEDGLSVEEDQVRQEEAYDSLGYKGE